MSKDYIWEKRPQQVLPWKSRYIRSCRSAWETPVFKFQLIKSSGASSRHLFIYISCLEKDTLCLIKRLAIQRSRWMLCTYIWTWGLLNIGLWAAVVGKARPSKLQLRSYLELHPLNFTKLAPEARCVGSGLLKQFLSRNFEISGLWDQSSHVSKVFSTSGFHTH